MRICRGGSFATAVATAAAVGSRDLLKKVDQNLKKGELLVVYLLFDVKLVIISCGNSYIRHPMVIPSLSRDLRALKDDKTTTVTLSGVKRSRTRRAVCDSTSGYSKPFENLNLL